MAKMTPPDRPEVVPEQHSPINPDDADGEHPTLTQTTPVFP